MKFLSIPETRICKECNAEFTAYIKDVILCPKCRRNKKEQKEKEEKEKTEFIKNYYNKQDNEEFDINQEEQKNENMLNSDYDIFDDNFDILNDIYMPPNRKCHDCGKPINDFRCEDCWRKWKIRNHISMNDEYLNGIDE